MPTESKRLLRLEIGHVLFIDIVSYSKLLISEQSELLSEPIMPFAGRSISVRRKRKVD